MINLETRKAYYEVLTILKYLPIEYTNMIPKQILLMFESQKEENKEFILDLKNPINKDNLSKQSIQIIAMINYEYWCKDENKKIFYDLYSSNEVKCQNKLREKYDVYKVFNERNNKNATYDHSKSISLIEYKEPFFKKIINKLRQILKL